MGGRSGRRDNTTAILAEQQRQRDAQIARENAERDRAERAQREAETAARFNQEVNSALNATRASATEKLADLGLDPNRYNDRIERELNLTRTRIPFGTQGAGQFFNTDFVDTIVNDERSKRRQNATARVQRELPLDFTTLFSTSADDPFIDQIFGRQSNEARTMLERAQRRGNITDEGFNAGLGRIGELERAGRAQAQALGDSIINRFRSEASDVRNRALERAGSLDISEPEFDITPFTNQLNEITNRFNTNLGGEIENALAGQSFFDIGDVLTRAGIAQGAQNPAAELSPAQVLAERQRRRREQAKRGIGGEGSF